MIGRKLLSVVATVILWASAAQAAVLPDGANPPVIADKTPWKALGFAAAVAVAVLAVAFKNARRTHLD